MAWYHLSQWLPCSFCQTMRASHHGICESCWKQLPWDDQLQQRQDVTFRASCFYQFPISRVIHQFKDQAQMQHLGLLQACLLQLPKPRVQAIVPMPLATEKLIERGFSQTFLLAHALSKQWQIPIWQPIARHHNQSQRGLDRQQRLENLEDSFYLKDKIKKSYRHVLMLDDVITTGVSLSLLQKQLILLGCEDIEAYCICNSILN